MFFFVGNHTIQNLDFIVSISNSTMTEDHSNWIDIYSEGPNLSNHSYIVLNESRILQFIKVEKNSSGVMAICEIEIFVNSKLKF